MEPIQDVSKQEQATPIVPFSTLPSSTTTTTNNSWIDYAISLATSLATALVIVLAISLASLVVVVCLTRVYRWSVGSIGSRSKSLQAASVLVRFAGFGSNPFTASHHAITDLERSALKQSHARSVRRLHDLALCAHNPMNCKHAEHFYVVSLLSDAGLLKKGAADGLVTARNTYPSVHQPHKLLTDMYASQVGATDTLGAVDSVVAPARQYNRVLLELLLKLCCQDFANVQLTDVLRLPMYDYEFVDKYGAALKTALSDLHSLLRSIAKKAPSADHLYLPIDMGPVGPLSSNVKRFHTRHSKAIQSLSHPLYPNLQVSGHMLVTAANDAVFAYIRFTQTAGILGDYPDRIRSLFSVSDLKSN